MPIRNNLQTGLASELTNPGHRTRLIIAMLIADYINWFGIICIGVALQQSLLATTAPAGPAPSAFASCGTTTPTTVADERATDHDKSYAGLV